MSLALIGRGASFEFRWRRWALLRDTVAMALEGGTSGERFPQLAALGDALVGARRLDARALADEIAALRSGLAGVSVTALAIGPATAAVLYMGAQLDAPRLLTSNERAQISPAGDARTLGEYFASMLDAFEHVCRHPAEDGMVEVVDG